jgi:hypothetical protein
MEYAEWEANQVYGRAVPRSQLDARFAPIFQELSSMALHIRICPFDFRTQRDDQGSSVSLRRDATRSNFLISYILIGLTKDSLWQTLERLEVQRLCPFVCRSALTVHEVVS